MSGPKMVGITCDPEVIARNHERLRQIGKEKYFNGVLGKVNTDIMNTSLWVENYGNGVMNNIPDGYRDESGIIKEVEALKKNYSNRIKEQVIDLKIIPLNSPEQLNKVGIQKVEDIPRWKEDFLNEISDILKKLQDDIEKFNECIKKNKIANERVLKESKERLENAKKEAHALDGLKIEQFRMERCMENEQNIPFIPQKEKSDDCESLSFTLDELALIEMFKEDLEKYSKLDCLENDENKLLFELKEELKFINNTGEKSYSIKSKRAVLQQMRLQYVRLEKKVNLHLVTKNKEREKRNTLEMEYISFCEALDINKENYDNWSISVLQDKVNILRNEVEKQETRIYIEETIEDIMKDYGYTGISSYQLHDAESVSRIIFEDNNGAKISTSFGDGMIMMNVIGEGENPPNDYEKRKMVHQQEAFCELYPQIRKKIQEKGIHINYENLMPVSAEQVSNEKIVRQKNIRKSTKKFSFRHVQLVSDNQNELQFNDNSVAYLHYEDREE